MEVKLKPGRVVRFLLLLVAGFTLAHIVLQFVPLYLPRPFGLSLLDVDLEQSILRFLSALLLLLCSSLFLIIGMAKKGINGDYVLAWWGLAVIFFFLAITKETAIHENIATPIRAALHLSKIQFYAWAYGIVVIIFPLLYLKFLLSLPRRTIFLLIVGGCIFAAGAFGLDLLTALMGSSIDHRAVVYVGLSALEDVLEMSGTIVLVYGLLSYMSSDMKQIRVEFSG